MQTLEKLLVRADQINDFVICIEGAMLETAAVDGMSDSMKKLHSLVYILEDQLRSLSDDLEELDGHVGVCNAIFAVNHVEELKRELAELKSKAQYQKITPNGQDFLPIFFDRV